MKAIQPAFFCLLLSCPLPAIAQSTPICPRFPTGSAISAPEDLYSSGGFLVVNFTYQTTVDQNGNTLYCFVAADGAQSPTLHLNPGDRLILSVTNQIPDAASLDVAAGMNRLMRMPKKVSRRPVNRLSSLGPCDINQDGTYNSADVQDIIDEALGLSPPEDDLNVDGVVNVVDVQMVNSAVLGLGCQTPPPPIDCGDSVMSAASVNVHFHGTNTPPTCHQDEVIRTIINPGETFQYNLPIPLDEPPGLYWYHPHVHGISESAVLGGASGAIVVEGLQNINPAVASLAQQILIVRDNVVPGASLPADAPAKDLSLNYVPVPYPNYPPAQIAIGAGVQQLWRVVNACADTILDLQVTYDGQVQPLQIVALDGVPTGSQDGAMLGSSVTRNDILIPPAGRAEFIVIGPSSGIQSAILSTLNVDTGPAGDNDPQRPLATIQTAAGSLSTVRTLPKVSGVPPLPRFKNLASTQPTGQRSLYFSEIVFIGGAATLRAPRKHGADDGSTVFFITVQGQTPQVFDPNNPPAIVTTEGAVEDWTIENQTFENHEFHIHQIHFLEVAQNGVPVTGAQYQDTIDVPYWSGTGPYPSVTLRMDFRGVTPGDFVYHCHILGHEDGGMMAIIQVVAASGQ